MVKICPLWDARALKCCFISNRFASLGRVIWDPLHAMWKQRSLFCLTISFVLYNMQFVEESGVQSRLN